MELIDEHSVKLGQCIRVVNVEKKAGNDRSGADTYVSIQVEDENGDNERCLLFTLAEFSDMEKIELHESLYKGMIIGRTYPAKIATRPCYLARVRHYDTGRIMLLRISITQLTKADKRAARHPESVTKKSFLSDLMD